MCFPNSCDHDYHCPAFALSSASGSSSVTSRAGIRDLAGGCENEVRKHPILGVMHTRLSITVTLLLVFHWRKLEEQCGLAERTQDPS